MLPQFVSGAPLLEAAWAVGILLVSALVGWVILLGVRLAERKLESRGKATLSSQLLESLTRPIFLLVVSQGLILALNSLSYLAAGRPALGKVSIALVIAMATYGLMRTTGALLVWYLHKAKVRQSLIRLIRRVTILLISVGGLLVLLDFLEISITPMIAGLGLGGNPALIFQPGVSLSNR